MHRHESQHGEKVHNAAGGQAPHRNPADHRVDFGRNCEKRDTALHDPAHPRGGELPPGAPTGRAAAEKRREEKTVRSKIGPVRPCVRFWSQGRETTPGKRLTGPVGAV